MSNVLARVLILINLRGVKLRVGLGRGVRYYKELRIMVTVVMMGVIGIGARRAAPNGTNVGVDAERPWMWWGW